jgi:hypothetical protein
VSGPECEVCGREINPGEYLSVHAYIDGRPSQHWHMGCFPKRASTIPNRVIKEQDQ